MERLIAYRCVDKRHTRPDLLVVDAHAYEAVATETRRSGTRVIRAGPLCREHADAHTGGVKGDGTEVEVEIVELPDGRP